MTKLFKFLLGLFIVLFIVVFMITMINYFLQGEISKWMGWADIIFFGLSIFCIPCITLSETKRIKEANKRWAKENGYWKNDKEKNIKQ